MDGKSAETALRRVDVGEKSATMWVVGNKNGEKRSTVIGISASTWLLLFILLAAVTSFPQDKPSGNNSDAKDFAAAVTELSKATWPKASIVWHLELTPARITGDIVQYRMSVTYCKATVSTNDEWFGATRGGQENLVRAWLNSLHKPPAIRISKTIDYYPNSSGKLVVKVGDKVVAWGTYTRTKTDTWISPGTSKSEAPLPRYTGRVFVIHEAGGVRFKAVTNLPPSESILFTLSADKYWAQSKSRVINGEATTEIFSNQGRPLSPGRYSLDLNVFNPTTGLMLEATARINLFETKVADITFTRTKF